jgi:hypothetical protein
MERTMKKTYEKPTLVRRTKLAEVTAKPLSSELAM